MIISGSFPHNTIGIQRIVASLESQFSLNLEQQHPNRFMALVVLKKNTLLSQLESLRQENVGLERSLGNLGARTVTLKNELDCLRTAVRVADAWAHYDELTELRERLRLYSDVLVKLERSVR